MTYVRKIRFCNFIINDLKERKNKKTTMTALNANIMAVTNKRRPLRRPRRRWEDNIKTGLQEVGWRHGLDRCGSE